MFRLSPSDCVECVFSPENEKITGSRQREAEVFYAESKNIKSYIQELRHFLSAEELLRAGKFHFETDHDTFICCHALLRLILAKKLNTKPLRLSFIKGMHGKPGLPGDPVFFNISHTRNSFAIAVTADSHIGTDIEELSRSFDFDQILKTRFSIKERDFILKAKSDAREKFILLWTRKEALLKAIGTGMVENLSGVEVSGFKNVIMRESFGDEFFDLPMKFIFLYSTKIDNNYLSVALPHKALVSLNHIDSDNINSYLH